MAASKLEGFVSVCVESSEWESTGHIKGFGRLTSIIVQLCS